MNYPSYPVKDLINVTAFTSCFRVRYDPSFTFAGERHNSWEFVYVYEGCVGITAEDKVFELSAGQAVFHKPSEFHRIWSGRNTSPLLQIMSFSASGERMRDFENGVYRISEEQEKYLVRMMDSAKEVFEGFRLKPEEEICDPLAPLLMKLYLELFLVSVLQNSSTVRSQAQSHSVETYHQAVRFLSENLFRPLTVDEVAEACRTSVSNLKKVFRLYAGGGIIRYFNKLKINEAKKRMEQDFTMREISDALGFLNQNYFSIAFKRETGFTPTEYKKHIARS